VQTITGLARQSAQPGLLQDSYQWLSPEDRKLIPTVSKHHLCGSQLCQDLLQQSWYTVSQVNQLHASKDALKASLKVEPVQQMVQLCKKQPGKGLSKQSPQKLSGLCQQRWHRRRLSLCTADKVKHYGQILSGQNLMCLSRDNAAGLAQSRVCRIAQILTVIDSMQGLPWVLAIET